MTGIKISMYVMKMESNIIEDVHHVIINIAFAKTVNKIIINL